MRVYDETRADGGVHEQIAEAKSKLGADLLILGHHYQQDDVIRHADQKGDSLQLARQAAQNRIAKYIVFCGVHFMAETADILTEDRQVVILPDLGAGCFLADQANINQVCAAWDTLSSVTDEKITPITYVNSEAALKAFCGERGGAVCTSSNARGVIQWGFEGSGKVFFFPDQHLGRNTAYQMGVPLEEMIVWDPELENGGNDKRAIRQARVILWKGHCDVHHEFQESFVETIREKHPDIRIFVHPECNFNVCQKADLVSSTGGIINAVKQAEPGTKIAIGTEHHLVNRLRNDHPDLDIVSLASFVCKCETMYKINPLNLRDCLVNLVQGKIVNQITVPVDTAKAARVALDRMLSMVS
ncbi:MAG: quinolinate synthetase [Candidatus Cloacimonetes bacterium 4572_55]|nr:MAG: quinolinate synthetase [Candidatus Cloacimonetes bacterium 4572_55]